MSRNIWLCCCCCSFSLFFFFFFNEKQVFSCLIWNKNSGKICLQTHLGEHAFPPLGSSFNGAAHMKKLFMSAGSELLLIPDFKIWRLKKLAPNGLRLVTKWWKQEIQRQGKGDPYWLTDSWICSCYGKHISSGFLQFVIKLSISKRHICKSILKMWIY